MKFCRTSVALLLAASAEVITASIGDSFSASFGVAKKHGAFGIQKVSSASSSSDLITSIKRGGATKAAVEGDEEEAKEIPQVLYLPGLLDAVVVKKKVGEWNLL